MILTVALSAGAALVAAQSGPRRRVFVTAAPAQDRRQPPVVAASLVGGLGVAWLLGGAFGVVVGGAVAVLGPRLLRGLTAPPDDDREVAAALPVALDLLAACLVGGAGLATSVQVVAEACSGALGQRLRAVAGALEVGAPAAEAWRALGAGPGPAGAAARALVRSTDGGAPVAAAVRRVAHQAREAQTAQARERARRAGVLVVGPLGLCFLPAFVLLGIVPAVVGLAAPILAG